MLNNETFLNRCYCIHGDRYDFSKTHFVKAKENVTVICPEHGEFSIQARLLYSGRGCPKCGFQRKSQKRSDTLETFIAKSRITHGNKYDYSLVDYKGTSEKVEIVCPEHGTFWQRPGMHIRGNGCPVCGKIKRGVKKRLLQDEFITKAKKVHGDKYDYSLVVYHTGRDKVNIICPEHGVFSMLPSSHLSGQGCPKCAGRGLTQDDVLKNFRKVHGDKYDYSKVVFTKMHNKVTVICPEHGEFQITPSKHILGQGCTKCGIESRREKQFKTLEDFIEKSRVVHGEKYDYSKSEYVSAKTPLVITCKKHGDFLQKPNDHLDGHGCPKCTCGTSNSENEFYDFIKSIYTGATIRNSQELLDGKQEVDVLLPDKQIAFEYDGLFWHSEKMGKGFRYHLNKTEKCKTSDVQLIHIFEDEWQNKRNICISRIKNLLGVSEKRVYARKCEIRPVASSETGKFLDENHLQGKVPSLISYGLYFNGELVSLMTFGKLRKNLGSTSKEGSYELLRFCNKLGYSVPGAASRLFKCFIREYNPQEVISYADRRWSAGNMYEKIGFKLDHVSKPNYFYVINGKRYNRFGFRKDVLVRKYGCPPEMTEKSFCESKGWYRIYDCGCLVYKWEKTIESE